MSLKLPKSVEVELKYPYLGLPVVYKFPVRQQSDAALEERERLFGGGRKMRPSDRLAALVEDVHGFESMGLDPRKDGEDVSAFRHRVAQFFDSADGQELAEHAVIYRGLAVSPQSTFRSGPDSGVAEHIRGQEAEQRPGPPLSDVRPAGEGPKVGVPDMSADQGGGDAKEAGQG